LAFERWPARTRIIAPQRRRVGIFVRKLRATWRDSTALWREFRIPVLLFIFVTVVGGYIYGELYTLA
jgi:hypothetical protein